MNKDFDPFGDSEEFRDEELDETSEIHDPVGASPVSPADLSGKPNRKGLYIIIAVVVAFIGIWVFAGMQGGDEPAAESQVAQTQVDRDQVVAEPNQPSRSTSGDDDILADLPDDVVRDIQSREKSNANNTDLIRVDTAQWASNPAPVPPAEDLFGDFPAPSPEFEPDSEAAPTLLGEDAISQALLEDNNPLDSPASESADQGPARRDRPSTQNGRGTQDPPLLPPDSYIEPGFAMTQPSRESALEEQLRLEAERQAAEERKQAERERLRSAGTLLASNDQVLQGATAPASSSSGLIDSETEAMMMEALGPEEGARLANMMRFVESDGGATPGSTRSDPTRRDPSGTVVTPGARVQAVTISEYVGGQAGSGIVEARLTSPLRDQGSLLLPAGTRAYGDARMAAPPGPGRDARVSIAFHTFVTPDGRVIRDGLSAYAADPQTLAASIKAEVDNNTLSRIVRGGTATAIDFFITQNTQARSLYEQPSPRDLAISDARERVGDILASDLGDEGDIEPVVRLPAETAIMLVFGL